MNGTISRDDLDETCDVSNELDLPTDLDDDGDVDDNANLNWNIDNQLNPSGHNDTSKFKQAVSDRNEQEPASPDAPLICETINDFCARHSREEMEFLISQIGFLKISDCYFSEKKSTLCTVIELKRNNQN